MATKRAQRALFIQNSTSEASCKKVKKKPTSNSCIYRSLSFNAANTSLVLEKKNYAYESRTAWLFPIVFSTSAEWKKIVLAILICNKDLTYESLSQII